MTETRTWTLPAQPAAGTVVGCTSMDVTESLWMRIAMPEDPLECWLEIEPREGKPLGGELATWGDVMEACGFVVREYPHPRAGEGAAEPAHHGAVFVLRTLLRSERPVTLSLHPDETWGGFELRLQVDGEPGYVMALLQPRDAVSLASTLILPEARPAVTS